MEGGAAPTFMGSHSNEFLLILIESSRNSREMFRDPRSNRNLDAPRTENSEVSRRVWPDWNVGVVNILGGGGGGREKRISLEKLGYPVHCKLQQCPLPVGVYDIKSDLLSFSFSRFGQLT